MTMGIRSTPTVATLLLEPMKFEWNPKANPRTNKRWGVRLFHDAMHHCLRIPVEQRGRGNTPPEGYFPCEKCFPIPSKARRELKTYLNK